MDEKIKDKEKRRDNIKLGGRSLEDLPDLQASKDMLLILEREALNTKALHMNLPKSLEEGARLIGGKKKKKETFWEKIWSSIFK